MTSDGVRLKGVLGTNFQHYYSDAPEASHMVMMFSRKYFSCITLTVEHNYISPSSTVGIQLHVSALYVGHLQDVI